MYAGTRWTLQRRLSLHPNVVRFMGACCHIPSTGRPFQDDTLDNWQVRTHHAKPMPANTPAPAVSHEVMYDWPQGVLISMA